MDTIPLLIQIPPHEIAYLTFVIESYEGVAAIRTVDPHEGIVELMVPPSYEEEIEEILKDLAHEFQLHRMVQQEISCKTWVQGHNPPNGFVPQ